MEFRIMQILNKERLCVSLLLFSLLFMPLQHSNAIDAGLPHLKPSSPISVRIQALTEPVAGQFVEFEVVASTTINAAKLTIEVELPVGWNAQSGSLYWQGELTQNQEKDIRFSVRVPSNGQFNLIARATMRAASKGQLSAINFYSIGSPAKLQGVGERQYRFTQRDGRKLIQYKIP